MLILTESLVSTKLISVEMAMRFLKTGGDGNELDGLKCLKGSGLDLPLQLTHSFVFPMPASSFDDDLGFLVSEGSFGHDSGVH